MENSLTICKNIETSLSKRTTQETVFTESKGMLIQILIEYLLWYHQINICVRIQILQSTVTYIISVWAPQQLFRNRRIITILSEIGKNFSEVKWLASSHIVKKPVFKFKSSVFFFPRTSCCLHVECPKPRWISYLSCPQ